MAFSKDFVVKFAKALLALGAQLLRRRRGDRIFRRLCRLQLHERPLGLQQQHNEMARHLNLRRHPKTTLKLHNELRQVKQSDNHFRGWRCQQAAFQLNQRTRLEHQELDLDYPQIKRGSPLGTYLPCSGVSASLLDHFRRRGGR